MTEDLKVEYVAIEGYKSKAYVSGPNPDGTWDGENKHTDDPVSVYWDDALNEWVEVKK